MEEKDISILDKLGVDIGYKTTHTKNITEKDIELFAEMLKPFFGRVEVRNV